MATRHPILRRILTLLAISLPASALASVRAGGTFEAVRTCEAFKSFKKGTNPGFVRLEPGQTYAIEELNEQDWDWIRINVPDVQDPSRWVPKECGVVQLMPGEPAPSAPSGRPPPGERPGGRAECNIANTYDSNVLSMSWQPGFCEHARFSGTKPECDALERGELAISHLTMHGLWPNKKACGTRYGGCRGPALDLSEDTRAEVAPWMPNLMFETDFATHEWDKHGTCQARQDDEYFLTIKQLTELVDRSAIGKFIRSNIGKEMSVNDFFANVRRELGPDVEQRIQLLCAGGRFLQEIRLSLPRDIVPSPDIAKMVQGAPRVMPRTSNCNSDTIFIERSGRD
ncbi:ribonuclease T2 family protein [Archangium violaceum]|uniref:ribonuclease T2 family protein n=1 Tax=Archangium violaceum TaxID=83451 RepID=UPI0036DE7D78